MEYGYCYLSVRTGPCRNRGKPPLDDQGPISCCEGCSCRPSAVAPSRSMSRQLLWVAASASPHSPLDISRMPGCRHGIMLVQHSRKGKPASSLIGNLVIESRSTASLPHVGPFVLLLLLDAGRSQRQPIRFELRDNLNRPRVRRRIERAIPAPAVQTTTTLPLAAPCGLQPRGCPAVRCAVLLPGRLGAARPGPSGVPAKTPSDEGPGTCATLRALGTKYGMLVTDSGPPRRAPQLQLAVRHVRSTAQEDGIRQGVVPVRDRHAAEAQDQGPGQTHRLRGCPPPANCHQG
ncbi:hypothetical protein BT67DRAFT_301716 [Trichocladium antarcticum]|uniref:Uncharacterized protein n=1 Tax=Trichocladium antarcticum TaxID=1450529 RepID=A0AAN6ZEN1_9PEZI|nr:hypothetical protein BT67DRAFT_301716 [Trichocladium antarcticum]